MAVRAAGTYTGQVVLQTSGNTVTIPVSVTVGANVFQQMNALNFTMPFQGANPLPQVLTVASTSASFKFYTAPVNSTGNWLSTSTSTSYTNTTPYGVTVTVTTAPNMAAGTYTDEIVFQSSDGTQTMTVPVTLTIEPPTATFFDNLPGQLSFSGKPDGSALATQSFQIRRAGVGTLAWTLSTSTADGGNWLTASSSSGTGSSLVTMSVVTGNLPNGGLASGTYTGQVVLQAAGQRVTVPVSVQLGANVFQQKQPLNFTMAYQGTNPPPQVLTVASIGTDFKFYTNPVNSTGSWLSTNTSSSYSNTTPFGVMVTVTAAANKAQGTYTDEIIFQSTDGTMTMTVPVTLTVGNGGNQTPVAATPTFTPAGGNLQLRPKRHAGGPVPPVPPSTTRPTALHPPRTQPSTPHPSSSLPQRWSRQSPWQPGTPTARSPAPTYTITTPMPSPKTPGFLTMASVATGASTSGVSLQAVAADFNGDGIPDLATTNNVDATVGILLGKGNGTFQTPVTYAVGKGPYGIVGGRLQRGRQARPRGRQWSRQHRQHPAEQQSRLCRHAFADLRRGRPALRCFHGGFQPRRHPGSCRHQQRLEDPERAAG